MFVVELDSKQAGLLLVMLELYI